MLRQNMTFPHFIVPKAGLLRPDAQSKISEQACLPCVSGKIRTIAICLRRWRPRRTRWRVAKVGFGGLIEEFGSRTSVFMSPGPPFFCSLFYSINPLLRDSNKSQNPLVIVGALRHFARMLLMQMVGRGRRSYFTRR